MRNYFQTLTYGLTAVAFIVSGAFQSQTIDIALHDTYLSIGAGFPFFLTGLLFLFYTFCTWAQEHFNRKPNKLLFLLHYLITLTGLLITTLFLLSPSPSQQFQDYTVEELFDNHTFLPTDASDLYIAVMITLIAQSLFFINILLSLLNSGE